MPSLVTPGTLLVLPSFHSTLVQHNVAKLEYNSREQAVTSTYSVNFTTADNVAHSLFHGPRTLISRLSTATATSGVIQAISAPFAISSYSLDFFGPAIQCGKANESVAAIIGTIRNTSIASYTGNNIRQYANYYFAFVPDFSNAGNASRLDNGVSALVSSRLQQPVSGSNQLWMAYSQYYLDAQGQRKMQDHFSVCQLWNASYQVDITFNQTFQSVTPTKIDYQNVVEYPDENAPYSLDLMVQHAYSAYMVCSPVLNHNDTDVVHDLVES